MKFPTMIRIGVLVIGLGAALTLTSSVRAQEIENKVWADGPNVVPFEQAATAKISAVKPVAATTVKPGAKTIPAAAPQQASVFQQSPAMVWLFPMVVICMALVTIPALVKSKSAARLHGEKLRGEGSVSLKTAA
jgi:hypothetical protein